MSGKRRHHERDARRRAIEERARLDAMARGVPVDTSALAPNNSYGQPEFVERGYYVDTPFVCETCGVDQIWTASQQKWWYEVAKGDVFSTATRCRPCRQAERARRESAQLTGGDPNPFKNPGGLIKRIRSEIEPRLLSAGYRLAGRSARGAPILFLDYTRQDEQLTLSWEGHQARLAAERIAAGTTELQVLAEVRFRDLTTAHVEEGIASFMKAMQAFLETLEEASRESP